MLYIIKLEGGRTKISIEEPESGFYVAVESLPESAGELMFDEDDNLYYGVGSISPTTDNEPTLQDMIALMYIQYGIEDGG